MARRLPWPLVIALGCAHTAQPPATGEAVAPVEVACAAAGFYGLSLAAFPSETGTHDAFYSADTAARAHYDRAAAAGAANQFAEAGQEFLACGREYGAVKDADMGSATATKNAQLCYANSILAFANAGELAAHGRALLEQAGRDDPRYASYIRDQLAAAPSDCAVKPSR